MVLFDDIARWGLLPLTFTRPCADLRIGISTLREKWELALSQAATVLTAPHLRPLFAPATLPISDDLYINATVLPTTDIVAQIQCLKAGEALADKHTVVALRTHLGDALHYEHSTATDFVARITARYRVIIPQKYQKIQHWWHIFALNDTALRHDFAALTHGRVSQILSPTNTIIGNSQHVFLEEGAKVEAAILNVSQAPIYIGKHAEIMEGCMVRGGLALGEHATLKMGTKIYGATTVGRHSKVGGEINNSVIMGYSNKAHDGFMGNSVIGEWCNWGADSNNSNLKNNYSPVSVWNYTDRTYQTTGLQFCGMVMGDHAKCGINTMFNTGTTIGVCANIFGGDFPPKHIPSFAWGGAAGFEKYELDKAIDTARRVYERRHIPFAEQEMALLTAIWQQDGQR